MYIFTRIFGYLLKLVAHASLGASWWSKLLIIMYYVWFTVLNRLNYPPAFRDPRIIKIRVINTIVKIFIKHYIDFVVLQEVFLDKEYEIEYDIDFKVIFDLGSNVGASVLFFILRYPSAHIYAFEPDPDNILMFNLNLAPFMDRITLIEKAVWKNNDEIRRFYKIAERHYSSSIFEREKSNIIIEVRTITLDKIINDYKLNYIDLMKFDIEGAEKVVFETFEQIGKVHFLIGEVHPGIVDISVKSFSQSLQKFRLVRFSKSDTLLLINKEILQSK